MINTTNGASPKQPSSDLRLSPDWHIRHLDPEMETDPIVQKAVALAAQQGIQYVPTVRHQMLALLAHAGIDKHPDINRYGMGKTIKATCVLIRKHLRLQKPDKSIPAMIEQDSRIDLSALDALLTCALFT